MPELCRPAHRENEIHLRHRGQRPRAPCGGAFASRRQVASLGIQSRKAEPHGEDRDDASIVEGLGVDPHPIPQAVTRGIGERQAGSMNAGARCLTGDEYSGGCRCPRDGARLVRQPLPQRFVATDAATSDLVLEIGEVPIQPGLEFTRAQTSTSYPAHEIQTHPNFMSVTVRPTVARSGLPSPTKLRKCLDFVGSVSVSEPALPPSIWAPMFAPPVLRPDEAARPHATTGGTGLRLLLAMGTIGQSPAVTNHRGVEVEISGATLAETATISVEPRPTAGDGVSADQVCQMRARLFAAGMATAGCGIAALGQFRGIDPQEAYSGPVERQTVAVSHVGVPGHDPMRNSREIMRIARPMVPEAPAESDDQQ